MSARVDRIRAAIVANPSPAFGVDLVKRWTRIPCSLHGGRNPNLAIGKDGMWTCHSRKCHGEKDSADALAYIAYRYGLAQPGTPLSGDAFTRTMEKAEALYSLPNIRTEYSGTGDAKPVPKRAPMKRERDRTADAQRLWADALPLDDDEAAVALAYLRATRRVWPDDRKPPGMVRAIPVYDAPRGYDDFPEDTTIFIAYGLCAPTGGQLIAIEMDALTEDARLPKPERWRRTLGPKTGVCLRVKGVSEGGVLALCEGPLDALALAQHEGVAEARAAMGTSGLKPELARGWTGPITIYVDGDDEGLKAARVLYANLNRDDVVPRDIRVHIWPGADPAEGEGEPRNELAEVERSTDALAYARRVSREERAILAVHADGKMVDCEHCAAPLGMASAPEREAELRALHASEPYTLDWPCPLADSTI